MAFADPKLRHLLIIPEENPLKSVQERFGYIVNVERGFTMVKIDDQYPDILIYRFLLQAIPSGSRHPFSPSSP